MRFGRTGGDVNGDGVDDVIVGADQLFNEGTGKAYVFYGPLAGSIRAVDANAILPRTFLVFRFLGWGTLTGMVSMT